MSASIPVVLVNPGRTEVGGYAGSTGGHRKVYRELYDYVRMLGNMLRKTPEDIQRSVWMNKAYGEILSLSVIKKILSPAESFLKKDAAGNRVPLPTRAELEAAGLKPVKPARDYLVRSVREIATFRDMIDRMGFREKVLNGSITEQELSGTLPNIWPAGTAHAAKVADLQAMLKGSEAEDLPAPAAPRIPKRKSTAVTRQKQPTKLQTGGTGMTTEAMVAEVMANPAIAEIAMNPGYAFPDALANSVLGFFKSKGAEPSRARAGLKQLLKRMFGQKGLRWSMNRKAIGAALDRVFPGRPKRPLPPSFKPFTRGDARLGQYRQAFSAKRPQSAAIPSITQLRSFLGMPERGKRLSASQARIEKHYIPVPVKAKRAARPRPQALVPALSMGSMIDSGVGYKVRPYRRPVKRNPAYTGGFISGVVETAIEGGGMALVGALTLKGTSWVDKNLVTKVIKPGADDKTNPWARLITSVVVGSVAGGAAKKFLGRTEIARRYNVGDILGNGIAVGAMLYAFGGFESKYNPFSGIDQAVGSYATREMPGGLIGAPSAPVAEREITIPTQGVPMLSGPVGSYTMLSEEGMRPNASVGVRSGIPLT